MLRHALRRALTALILLLLLPLHVPAQERIIASYTGTGGFQGAIWAAQDLGYLEKHGFKAELVMIPGGSRSAQALLSGSTQFEQGGAPTISAILGGAELVMVAGAVNKFPFSIVTHKDIRKPSDLVGKKIGVVNFGGMNELAVILALKEWNIPRQAVTVMPAGPAAVRLVGLVNKAIDATMLAPPETIKAAEMGLNILADFSDMEAAYPVSVISVRRAFLKGNRETVKRFIRAYSEGIYELKTNREKGLRVYASRLRQQEPKIVQETYSFFAPKFSFPPRLDPEGLRNALRFIAERTPGAAAEGNVERIYDPSIVNELEKEGFFSKVARSSGR
ncbi:MAG: ABC transporter substrate-binding protein [Deltaproteobacteria bacterium]|nr:ABC transporter substrate-binding protein [Deltaproteobacteria bacterium]